MSDEIESEAPEELRRAQRRQIHAIGASTLSVVALVAATALGVHAWHRAPHPELSSSNVAAPSQPLVGTPAESEPAASASELAPDASPIDSPSSEPSPSPSPSARPTPSTIDSNGQRRNRVETHHDGNASPRGVRTAGSRHRDDRERESGFRSSGSAWRWHDEADRHVQRSPTLLRCTLSGWDVVHARRLAAWAEDLALVQHHVFVCSVFKR